MPNKLNCVCIINIRFPGPHLMRLPDKKNGMKQIIEILKRVLSSRTHVRECMYVWVRVEYVSMRFTNPPNWWYTWRTSGSISRPYINLNFKILYWFSLLRALCLDYSHYTDTRAKAIGFFFFPLKPIMISAKIVFFFLKLNKRQLFSLILYVAYRFMLVWPVFNVFFWLYFM